ncbi:MAG: NAD(P) transhydrogenase subunit alpha, partial [Micromonosporaceae bacterium]|nr:NAD(P) transhydrogenase subunit alpha [Micromonosporaceae bacterium]
SGWAGYLLAFVAMAFASMNVAGGYLVTDRMLQMFKARPAVDAGQKELQK